MHCDFCPELLKLPCRLQADALPPVILVGNPSPARKLLVLLFNPRRELHAVVKLPMTLAARDYIRNRAETLRKLDEKNCAPSCSPQRKYSISPFSGKVHGACTVRRSGFRFPWFRGSLPPSCWKCWPGVGKWKAIHGPGSVFDNSRQFSARSTTRLVEPRA